MEGTFNNPDAARIVGEFQEKNPINRELKETWHERDLTQSSAERFIIPEACILLDYVLSLVINVLRGLRIDKERMRKNIDITQGRVMAESLMLNLTRKGMGRQEAHSLVREISLKSELEGKPFRDALLEDSEIRKFLSERDVDVILDPANLLGTALEQIDAMIEKTEKERKKFVRVWLVQLLLLM